jgi:hypothetical protein
MTPSGRPKNERDVIDWIVAGLGVVLAILLFFLFRQSEVLRRETIAKDRLARISASVQDQNAAMAESAGTIQSWMTFDYVNRIFALPPDYLKEKMSISDTRYPRLTIGEFSEDDRHGASSTLTDVRTAVRDYLIGAFGAATSST